MKIRIGAALAAIAIALTGCASAPQLPVPLVPNSLTIKPGKIGIVMTELPAPDTYLPGAGCLLCYAAAAAANSSLTTHTKTLTTEDLPKLKDYIADVIRKKGTEVVVIPGNFDLDSLPKTSKEGPNVARKDFSALRTKYNVDKLLVVDINGLGFERTYSSYFPTSDPKAFIQGTGYIVNLTTNVYEWYAPISMRKSADVAWDEPPKFPGLTNAYFYIVESGKDSFLKPLSN
jgi:hypothetical protein